MSHLSGFRESGSIAVSYKRPSADWTSLQGNAAADLKKEIHSLVYELNSLSMRNDQLMVEREQDAAGMNDMEVKVEEYRRKYEAVRIELRNLKGKYKQTARGTSR